MIILKYVILCLIFLIIFLIGNIISKKYILRLEELKDFRNALNIIENKIKFTYEPLGEVFIQTSKLLSKSISQIFITAKNNMKDTNAEEAWDIALKQSKTNLSKEDIESIQAFGKMLGKTDKEGQISSIELTKTFVEMQIEKARIEEEKNSKMYKTLGTIIGIAVVIILI